MDASATTRQSNSEDGDIQASRWPQDGGVIDRVDKAISSCIFSLQIGPLEWPLSVPGCVFGMAPILCAGPPTLAVLASKGPVPLPLSFILSALWTVTLGTWFSFCAGKEEYAKKYLFAKASYVFGPLVGLMIASLAEHEAWAVGAFFNMAWSTTLVPVLVLKGFTKRRRPAVSVPSTPKVLEILPRFLRKDANASFPSGDVAGAVAFAVPLAVGCGLPKIAGLVALGSAFGRMYWHAHHALDVLVGATIGVISCSFIRNFVCDVGQTKWWQPVVAHVALLVFLSKAMKAVKH